MIDLHTHLLPKIDDGAKSVETSVAMLKEAFVQGVDTLVCTPHYYGKSRSPSQFLAHRQEAFSKIEDYIPPRMQIRLGAEVHFTGVNMPDLEELTKLSIEGTKYILLEFPFVARWPKGLWQALQEFILETGYTPIVAHIERYAEIWKQPAYVSTLVKMGCLIQVNAGSFLDGKTKKLVYALLKHGLVHCIGSDAHDMDGRAPNCRAAEEALKKAGYAAEWEKIQENMATLLAGGQVCVENAKPVKKFFWKYL